MDYTVTFATLCEMVALAYKRFLTSPGSPHSMTDTELFTKIDARLKVCSKQPFITNPLSMREFEKKKRQARTEVPLLITSYMYVFRFFFFLPITSENISRRHKGPGTHDAGSPGGRAHLPGPHRQHQGRLGTLCHGHWPLISRRSGSVRPASSNNKKTGLQILVAPT